MLGSMGILGAALSSTVVSDTLSGVAPDVTNLAGRMLVTLPLCGGVSGLSAATAISCSQAGLSILAGNLPDMQTPLSGLHMLGATYTESLAGRTVASNLTSVLISLASGYAPEATSIVKDLASRSPYFLIALPGDVSALGNPLEFRAEEENLLSREQSDTTQQPYISDTADALGPASSIQPAVLVENIESPISAAVPPFLQEVGGAQTEPLQYKTDSESTLQLKAFQDTAAKAEGITTQSVTAADTVLHQQRIEGDKTTETMPPFDLSATPTPGDIHVENILQDLTPDIKTQLESPRDLIIIDTKVETISVEYDAEGKPFLRYALSQEVCDGSIVAQDHYATLLQRLGAGDEITWDHLLLAGLSLLRALTPEAFQHIIHEWMLSSSAKATRTCVVDIYKDAYSHTLAPKPETLTAHTEIACQYPGKQLRIDSRQVETKEMHVATEVSVHTAHIHNGDVRFGDRLIEGETHTESIAEQTIRAQESHIAYHEVSAGEHRVRGPEQHATIAYEQSMSFKAEHDLRALAQQGPLSAAQVKEDPSIRLERFDEQPVDQQRWETPGAFSQAAPELLVAMQKELQQGNFPQEKIYDSVEVLGTSINYEEGEDPQHKTYSKTTPFTSDIELSSSLEEGMVFDDRTEKRQKVTLDQTQEENIQVFTTTISQYTTYDGSGGHKEISREPEKVQSYVRHEVTEREIRKEQLVTITSNEILGKNLGGFWGRDYDRGDIETHITESREINEYVVSGKDIAPAIADGQLTKAELEALGAQRVRHASAPLKESYHREKDPEGRTFEEGVISYLPFGSLCTAGIKSSMGYDLSASDYMWAAADVVLCLATGGTAAVALKGGQAVAKAATKGGAKLAVREAGKLGVDVTRAAAQDVGKELISPVTMVQDCITIPKQAMHLMEKRAFLPALKEGTPSVEDLLKTADKAKAHFTTYSQEAVDAVKDLYYKLDNYEFSLKNFPSSILKDMTVENEIWQKLVHKYGLANKAETIRDITYKTDQYGRPIEAHAKKLTLQEAPRDVAAQQAVGKLGKSADEGGHLIGNRFGGEASPMNLVPQNMNLNRGEWKAMENSWERALRAGKEVTDVSVRPVYSGLSIRPYKIEVSYTIDGIEYKKAFYNKGK